jgi:hypothetical protein
MWKKIRSVARIERSESGNGGEYRHSAAGFRFETGQE